MDTPGVVSSADNKTSLQQPVLNVGMALREAREGMGLSVHDIANRVKFAPRQVEALEANDFANLPQATFLRGFVRSYARVLQLDEAVLIAALPADPGTQTVAKAQVVDVAFPTLLSLQRVNLLWVGGALGVALVLGLFIFTREGEPVPKATEVVVEPVSLPTADVAASAVTDTEKQPQVAEAVKVVVPQKKLEPVVAPKKPDAVVVPKKVEPVARLMSFESVVPQIQPEPVKPREPIATPVPQNGAVSAPATVVKPEVPLEALMRRPLHFVFGEAVFAEVIDARGGVLLSRNVPRGSEKWIGGPGRAPYKISVSNPGKVKLYYKGSLIDLSAYPANEMAHLTVK
jgi:cytoskeleton protein RodZ